MHVRTEVQRRRLLSSSRVGATAVQNLLVTAKTAVAKLEGWASERYISIWGGVSVTLIF